MKRNLLIIIIILAATFVYGQTVIGYTSFEEPSTGDQYVDTGNQAEDHALVNNTGQADVNFTSVGGEMGFSAYYTNTRDDVGVTDGDYIGVTTYSPDAGAFPDGAQAYQLSDADGKITVTLDPLTVSGATTVYFGAKLFVKDDGYEDTDNIHLWLTVDGTTNVDIFNLSGDAIEAYENIGTWATLTQEVNPTSSVVFHFEIDCNSGNEAFWIDNIVFTTGGAVPNPPIANAGADIFAETSSTVTLDGSSSSDIDDNIMSYAWAMVWGTQVSPTLTNANTAVATFTAPATVQDFHFELTVTDSTGLVDKDTVEVAVREPQDSKLIISEYIDGTSSNKAVELYNLDSNSVDLNGYVVKLASNGDDWGNEVALSGTLEGHGVYVITNDQASATEITGNSDTTSNITWFNGNDALGLFLYDVLVDVIGVQGEDPGSNAGWSVAGISNGTMDHTLVRKASVETPNINWTASAGTNESDSEWIVKDYGYYSDLGQHTAGPVAYTFSNATVTTAFPQAGSEISLTIDITPDEGVSAPTTIKVYYGAGGTQPNQADMWLETGTTYAGIIPALSEGNIVLDYYIAATGGGETVNSALYNMTVAGTVVDISDIHTNILTYDGMTKTIEGVITIGAGVLRDDRTSCYVQDASGRGLNLYDAEVLTDLTRGTRIKLVGEVELYFTTVEMINFEYTVVSTGQALPAAQAVTVTGANSADLEGTLATVTGTLSEVKDYSSSKNLILTEGTDSAIVKVWPTTGINADTLVIGTEYAITGVGSKYYDDYQLLVGYKEDITDDVALCEDCTPKEFALNKAYPNPFNPSTTIEFSMVEANDFEISVYNITGQKVSVLASGYAEPGVYKHIWNAADFTSGVYFIRLNAGVNVATQKVVLIK
ncbi:MAG: T9SS type A sorting domain-containing protein [Candidatus Marinimicrobia bacterium]|nr:T9SS type A sorting domain-containing protein [Candidatus Neomarinimicrobiota bacterium]